MFSSEYFDHLAMVTILCDMSTVDAVRFSFPTKGSTNSTENRHFRRRGNVRTRHDIITGECWNVKARFYSNIDHILQPLRDVCAHTHGGNQYLLTVYISIFCSCKKFPKTAIFSGFSPPVMTSFRPITQLRISGLASQIHMDGGGGEGDFRLKSAENE